MATEELVNETYSVSPQTWNERTLFGGVRLNSRIFLFVFFGLLAIITMGALLFIADQRISVAINKLKNTYQIAALVNRIEISVTSINEISNKFILSPNVKFENAYARKSVDASKLLLLLRKLPEAVDAQKLIVSIADGITQHAMHFQNIIELKSLLGTNDSSGLISNVAASGTTLEAKLRDVRVSRLINEMSAIREMENSLQSKITSENAKAATDAVNNLRRSLAASILEPKAKIDVAKSIETYSADIEQLARTSLLQSNEISSLDETQAYIGPNLTSLSKFSANLSIAAKANAESGRIEIKRILVSGALIILLALILAGTLLLRSIAYPVTDLANAAIQLARGNKEINIPALGNYDETGDVANALKFFRENMLQANRLRQELETYIKDTDKNENKISTPDTGPEQRENIQPGKMVTATAEPVPIPHEGSQRTHVPIASNVQPNTTGTDALSQLQTDIDSYTSQSSPTPLSNFSQQVAQTSESASNAAKDAEKCDIMVTGLSESLEKIEEIELLLASMSDQMSLLTVETTLLNELPTDDDPENLILLSGTRSPGPIDRKKNPSANDRLETLQSGTKRAIRAIQQIGKRIEEVNGVAIEFAAEASNDALEAATQLLHQSEHLRGMLDDLLGRIKPEDQTRSGP